MIKQRFYVWVLMFICLSTGFIANARDLTELNPVNKLTFSSEYFTGKMVFNVTLPQSYHSDKNKRYSLLLNLHPRSQPYLSGVNDWMSHNAEKPFLETLVITPAGPVNDTGQGQPLKQFLKAFKSPAGKTKMLDFIEQELLVQVDKNYRTNGFRVMSGFSSIASFSLHTLLNRPDLFNGYIVASPDLSGSFEDLLSTAKEKLKLLKDKPRSLFLSTGNNNYEQPHLAALKTLNETLKTMAPAQLEWQIKHFDGASYMSQAVLANMYGLEAIYKDVHLVLEADSPIAKQGAQAIVDHFKYLSEQKYGFNISAENSLTTLADSMLSKAPEQALVILTKTTQMYPDSAYAYHSLAGAYAALAQYENAIKYQTIATQNSQNMHPWHINNIKKQLEAYQLTLSQKQ
jgi:predicted esterase